MIAYLLPTAVLTLTLYWLYKPYWDAKNKARKEKRDYPSAKLYSHQKRNAAGQVKLDVTENFYHE